MLWKELSIGMNKYYVYVMMAAIFVIFFSKFYTTTPDNSAQLLKVSTIQNDKVMSELFKVAKESFKISYVNNIDAGYKSAKEKKEVDAFVYYDNESKAIKVMENKSSNNAKYVGIILEQITSKSQFELKFLDTEPAKDKRSNNLVKILTSFSFILSFVCLFVPHKMFIDEKKTMNALVFSPIKNYEIIIAKTVSTILLFCFATLFFHVSQELSLKETFLIFLIGLIYIPIGLLMGIFTDNKIVSAIFYPIMLISIVFPIALKNALEKITKVYDMAMSNNWSFIVDSFILIIIFLMMMLLVNYVFLLKLRRERV